MTKKSECATETGPAYIAELHKIHHEVGPVRMGLALDFLIRTGEKCPMKLASSIAETLGVELDAVLEFCQATAITADTGMELGEEDLEHLIDSLGAKPSEKVWVVTPS